MVDSVPVWSGGLPPKVLGQDFSEPVPAEPPRISIEGNMSAKLRSS
jgi:hypothetical protein